MLNKGIPIKNVPASLGGLSTQAVPVISTNTTTANTNKALVSSPVVNTGNNAPRTTVNNTAITLPNINAKYVATATELVQKNISNIILKIPEIKLKLNQEYPEDVLDVSEKKYNNGQFIPVEKNGISTQRPEVISVIDFQPVWKGMVRNGMENDIDGLSPVGKLVDMQFNAQWLRFDTLKNIITEISRNDTADIKRIFTNLRQKYQTEINSAKQTLQQYADFYNAAEQAKRSLDIRDINRSSFTQGSLPLSDFFENRMQFDANEFATYSNTKILMQLLVDFKAICEGYSYNLLDLTDNDRINDKSPVNIDTTYTQQNGFTFSIEQIRSRANPINAMDTNFFNGFLNSLPGSSDERIRLLITILSKELRVSKALGTQSNQSLLQNVFQSTNIGNPFDNIIGVVGKDIFTQPLGGNSLASSLIRPLEQNSFVLPFEKKYIDSEDGNKTYIPGTSYFVDTVFEIQGNNFNTTPFANFANDFTRKIQDTRNIIEKLLGLGERDNPLWPEKIIDSIYQSYIGAIDQITTTQISQQEFGFLNRNQAIVQALFSLANEDNKLKLLLFQFILLAGMAQNNSQNRMVIFETLAKELKSISSFPSINIKKSQNPNLMSGIGVLRPYIAGLADVISQRVMELTSPTNKTKVFNNKTTPREEIKLIANNQSSVVDRFSVETLSTGEMVINVSYDDIHKTLLDTVLGNVSSTNLLMETVNISNKLSNLASNNGINSFLIDDNSGRTRLNFVSTSSQILLVFEIFASMVAKYNVSIFNKSSIPETTFIKVNVRHNDFIYQSAKNIVSNTAAAETYSVVRPVGAYQPPTAYTPAFNTAQAKSRTAIVNTQISTPVVKNNTLSNFKTLEEKKLVDQNISSNLLSNSNVNSNVNITNLTFDNGMNLLKNSLLINKNKVKEETNIVRNILDILRVFEHKVRNGNNRFILDFTTEKLRLFLQNNTRENLTLINNPAQIRLAKNFIENLEEKQINLAEKYKLDNSGFNGVNVDVIPQDTLLLLYSLLSEPLFIKSNPADVRTKIITVGVPNGFSKQLSDRVLQAAITENTFKEKQFDVIAINVYKRDVRFDDIVFKPKTFLFDLSLFASLDYSYLQTRENEIYSRILQRVRVKDLETMTNNKIYRTVENIVEDDKYDFLTTEQKRSLIDNHTRSNVMSLYANMTTGMNISEETFCVDNSIEEVDSDITNLIFGYLRNILRKNIPNQDISTLLQNPAVDDETKDTLRLLSFGNTTFDARYLKTKILSRKLFDRVFHIPISTEDFEIDFDLTNQTKAGKIALSQNYVQENIITVDGVSYMRPRDINETTFEDYFITITNDI